MQIKSGQRFASTTCGTSVVVVRGPAGEVDLWCGGSPMVPAGEQPPQRAEIADGFSGPTLIGKRYSDDSSGLEVVCTTGGDGALSLGETVLAERAAKPLPSSD